MKKFTKKLTYSIAPANCNKANLTHLPNHTTNSVITPAMFKRECAEFDSGTLPFEHERYIG